jgi:hypothetical protein
VNRPRTSRRRGALAQPAIASRPDQVAPQLRRTARRFCGQCRRDVRSYPRRPRSRAARRVSVGDHLPGGRRSGRSGIDKRPRYSNLTANAAPLWREIASLQVAAPRHRYGSPALSRRHGRAAGNRALTFPLSTSVARVRARKARRRRQARKTEQSARSTCFPPEINFLFLTTLNVGARCRYCMVKSVGGPTTERLPDFGLRLRITRNLTNIST